MLEIHDRVESTEAASARLTLPFDARQKSRLRATLDDGRAVGLFLPRGTVLRGGDRLRARDGTLVEVCAAPQLLSTVRSDVPSLLLRAAYHLGNRHVPVQLGEGWIRYEHDHVLDGMVEQLGLTVGAERVGFEPEGGAYGGHSHTHGAHAHGAHTHGAHTHGADTHDHPHPTS
ncbi:MAG: urease accessory protein UreE [Sandaracinaceae bacterium]